MSQAWATEVALFVFVIQSYVRGNDLDVWGNGKFRINCRTASVGLTEFPQFCFHHKPPHVRGRYLYRVRLETCVVWAPWREWSSILLVENLEYTTLGFTRHTKEGDAGKKQDFFCLFLIIHAWEGCSLSFVFVNWHMYRYDGAGSVCLYICVCAFVIAQKCQVNQEPFFVCVCCKQPEWVPQCLCTRPTWSHSAMLEAAAFRLSPNQSEEGSATMSPAVWADGLLKFTTDNSSSATTLPHALIASNEVMKESPHSQPELSCSARCSSTCLCRMSGN